MPKIHSYKVYINNSATALQLSNFRIFLSLQKITLYQLIGTFFLLWHLTITYLFFLSVYLPIMFACIGTFHINEIILYTCIYIYTYVYIYILYMYIHVHVCVYIYI